MSHIDEGALHAYLDGALDSYPAGEAARIREHLGSCDECARHLEEERGFREQAESILASSAPVVQMPPLEDLRVMAERRAEASRVRGMSRVNRWGWAASVVLALGSGWMLRGAIPGMISPPMPEQQVVEPSVTAPEAKEVVGGVLQSEDDRRQEGGEADAEAGPVAGADANASERDVALGFADADEVEVRLEEETSGRDAPSGTLEGLVEPQDPPPPAAAQERARTLDSVTTPREPEERLPVDPAEQPVVARRAAAPAEVVELSSPTAQDRPAAGFRRLDDAAAAKSVLSLAESDAVMVPGLELVDIVRLEDAQVPGVVRVRQILADGDTLEVFHVPEGSDPSALPRRPADVRMEVVAPNGTGFVVLRADAARDELDEYLRRLLGG